MKVFSFWVEACKNFCFHCTIEIESFLQVEWTKQLPLKSRYVSTFIKFSQLIIVNYARFTRMLLVFWMFISRFMTWLISSCTLKMLHYYLINLCQHSFWGNFLWKQARLLNGVSSCSISRCSKKVPRNKSSRDVHTHEWVSRLYVNLVSFPFSLFFAVKMSYKNAQEKRN